MRTSIRGLANQTKVKLTPQERTRLAIGQEQICKEIYEAYSSAKK